MIEDRKYAIKPNQNFEEIISFSTYDPISLMKYVALKEAEESTGDALLRAGQTLYCPSVSNIGKLTRTSPDGIQSEGSFRNGIFVITSF